MLHLHLRIDECVTIEKRREGIVAGVKLVSAEHDRAILRVSKFGAPESAYETEITRNMKRLVLAGALLGVALLPTERPGLHKVGFDDPTWNYLIERESYDGSARWEWQTDGAQEFNKSHTKDGVVG